MSLNRAAAPGSFLVKICALVVWLAYVVIQCAAGVPTEHILIIGCDGFGSVGFTASNTPVLHRLMREGSYTYDTAATVAELFGLKAPAAWIGKPTREALDER